LKNLLKLNQLHQLNIYIIDDGSSDKTPLILDRLSRQYDKLKVVSRSPIAGGGKSGALNYALKFTHGEWLLVLDADAQLKQDSLKRLFSFVDEGDWSAVQLRKSVTNVSKNFLTSCQSMEMAMDAVFQYGRLLVAGVSELRGNGQLIKKDLSNSYVRLEVICDRQGFWLKPHCDIKEKLLSSLIFVNPFNESENLGTDFYDGKLNKIKTVPYKDNYGYFFSSGPNTWHGMEKKEIVKERRCLQVNYVTFKTDWKVEG